MADENKDAAPQVDETPISPAKNGGRRNSLEKLLQQRPPREELIESKKL